MLTVVMKMSILTKENKLSELDKMLEYNTRKNDQKVSNYKRDVLIQQMQKRVSIN